MFIDLNDVRLFYYQKLRKPFFNVSFIMEHVTNHIHHYCREAKMWFFVPKIEFKKINFHYLKLIKRQ
jgi:hypothetical protein